MENLWRRKDSVLHTKSYAFAMRIVCMVRYVRKTKQNIFLVNKFFVLEQL